MQQEYLPHYMKNCCQTKKVLKSNDDILSGETRSWRGALVCRSMGSMEYWSGTAGRDQTVPASRSSI